MKKVYVLAVTSGPFEKVEQFSDMMRLSEAVTAIADYSKRFPYWQFFIIEPKTV